MTDLFNIKSMPAPWQGLNYSVSWDGRGVVSKQQQLSKIWKGAFDACTRGYCVGFSFERGEAIRIDTATAWNNQDNIDHLIHLVSHYGGITGVAFMYREEAEQFVDELEKHIAWNLLKKDYDNTSVS